MFSSPERTVRIAFKHLARLKAGMLGVAWAPNRLSIQQDATTSAIITSQTD